jgi:hypothetical protein
MGDFHAVIPSLEHFGLRLQQIALGLRGLFLAHALRYPVRDCSPGRTRIGIAYRQRTRNKEHYSDHDACSWIDRQHRNYGGRRSESPDGKTLALASEDQTVILGDVALESLHRQACIIANRNLSREEWRNYVGERPFRSVCEKSPEPNCS